MSPAVIEAAIPAIESPQTHALDRAATWIGTIFIIPISLFYEKNKICVVYDNPATKSRKLANACVIIFIIIIIIFTTIARLEIYVFHNALNSVKIIAKC
jgi:hypothetical protein